MQHSPAFMALASFAFKTADTIAFNVQPADGVSLVMAFSRESLDAPPDTKLDDLVIAELERLERIAEAHSHGDGTREVVTPGVCCGDVAWIFGGRHVVWDDHFQVDKVLGRVVCGYEIRIPAYRMAALLRDAIILMLDEKQVAES